MTTKTIRQFFPLLCVLACLAYGLDAQIINEFPNGAVTLNSAQTISGVKNFTATPTIQCGTEPSPLASQKYVDMTADTLATAAALAYHPRLGSTTLDFNAARLYSTVGTTTNRVADVTDLELEYLAKQGMLPAVFGDVGTGTWSDLGQQYSQTHIRSLANVGNGVVLAGTQPNGKILRSTDYGATWLDLGQQYSQTQITSLANVGNGIVLAGTHPNGKILRSTDYGATWSDLGQQYSQTYIFSLTNVGNGIVLAGTYPGGKILRSTDYGATWSDLGQQHSQTDIYSLANVGNGVVLSGTLPDGKILRSTDYGATWSDLGQQYGQTQIRSLANVGNGIVLAGTHPNGKILRSTDYGATWSDLGQQYSQTYIFSLTNVGNGIVLAGTLPDGKILRSTDYGATWSDLGQQYSQTQILLLANVGNGVVLAGTHPNGKILRSAVTLSPYDALAQWLADGSREVRIATSTDAGDYKLQVNGNAYISATCSAAAFEDRSAAPDTLSDAYAIVQSHEAKNGHVDHSKLHPKLWGTKPVQVSSKQVEKQVAILDTEGKETEDFETITVQEPVIEIVPDQSKRNLSMLISAQSEVLKDIDKRLKALENNK